MTNRRVAEEIMGLCLHPKMSVRFGGMIECVDCGVPVSGPNQPLDYSTDLNHAKMAWDKLSDGEMNDVSQLLYHQCQVEVVGLLELVLDPAKLCEAMLSAKETT